MWHDRSGQFRVEAAFLGDRDELAGGDQAARRMWPTHQGLDRDDCGAVRGEQRLVMKNELVVVDRAPKGFGREPAKYRYDLIFLKEPLAAKVALQSVPTKPGVDAAHPGTGVLYFSRLSAKPHRAA